MEDTIDASPTKKLVVYVLTKDILLADAILDLIDNSIDGAKRLNSEDFSASEIKIAISNKSFQISDNCGGIPYEMARDYAFRFGRPDDYAPLDTSPKNAVGNFGVGMKRALLKMGNLITITSNTKSHYFEIIINVNDWLKTKEWEFKFNKLVEHTNPEIPLGTIVKVEQLYPGVTEQFGLTQFITTLESQIKEKQVVSIQKGLKIELNNQVLASYKIELLTSKDIRPIYKKIDLQLEEGFVTIQLYAGLDKSDNHKAGWNIICNGRTLLQADKSPTTGWGFDENSLRIPSYHNQYGQFRGYVFFKSDDIRTLPWNTTKSSVDQEHPAFRRVFQEMVAAMRQVFTFLNTLDKESESEEQPLKELLNHTKSVALANIQESTNFIYPATPKSNSSTTKLTWIRYKRPTEQVLKVMDVLGVKKADEVGTGTFDLFYELNVDFEG